MCFKNFGKGQALGEYALPVAVIVLASIPALVMVGNNLQNFTKDTSITIKGNPEAALQAAAVNMETAARWREASTGKQLGPYQGKYNVHNGNISVKIPGFLGGGHANFSEGSGTTRALSSMLKKMAAQYRDEYGEPMPSELRKRIEKLAETGHTLANKEAAVNQKKGDKMSVVLATQDFYQQFNSVKQELNRLKGNGVHYGEVKDVIRGYSGIITANAYANYTDGVDNGAITGTDNYNTKKYLIGEQPQRTVSQDKTPVVTHQSSNGINTST